MQYNIILHVTQRNTPICGVTVPHLFGCGPRKMRAAHPLRRRTLSRFRPWQGIKKPVLMHFAPLCLDSL